MILQVYVCIFNILPLANFANMLQKILIVSLLVTSLIPSMFLNGSNFRYLPAFTVLFISGIYALFNLKKSKNLNHLKIYYQNNKYILVMVFMYLVVIWVSSFKTGIKENLVLISGMTFVLIAMHFLFPVFIKKKEDVLFIAHTLLFIGLFNCIITILLFLLKQAINTRYGIYGIQSIASKFGIFPEFNIEVLRGIFSNPNSLGILSASILPAILFSFAEAKSPRSRFFLILFFLLNNIVLLSSFSRASVLSAIVVLLFFSCSYVNRIFFHLSKIFILFTIVLFNFIIILGCDISYLKNLKITSVGRVSLWNKAIEIIHNNLIHGIGFSKTAIALKGLTSHNTFIEISLGSGVVAMILYSFYLILLLPKINLKDKDTVNLSHFTLLSILGFSVMQLFETLLFGGLSIANFYFLITIIAYLSLKQTQTKLNEN